MKEFLDRVFQLESLAIIGMEKNVGKTTALNYIIAGAKANAVLGLTSIGVDGETEDIVTGTEKPAIYVHRGTLLATAKNPLLSSDITKEILYTTGIQTPMGEVVIFRALSDGYVELMGPSINAYLRVVIRKLRELGCSTVIVDGALNRSSSADPSISEGVLLATGAALSSDRAAVVARTAHKLRLLSIPYETDKEVLHLLQKALDTSRIIFIKASVLEASKEPTVLGAEVAIIEALNNGASGVAIKGVVGDRLIQQLLRQVQKPEEKTIYVEDGTKLFINSENYERLLRKGFKVRALNPIRVIAISVNPYSPEGFSIDSKRLCQELYEETRLPIVDVVSCIGVGL